jgi:hypothetical protein
MHRVPHLGVIDEVQPHPLALLDPQRVGGLLPARTAAWVAGGTPSKSLRNATPCQ